MKIGIIGTGGIAKAHIRALGKLHALQLTGVYDINLESAQKVASENGCTVFATPEQLIEAVDGVIIASPNFMHQEQSLLVLQANKHVLCEKPMAVSLDEARTMSELAKQCSASACVGFNYRYLPIIREIKRLLDNGEIGELLAVKLGFQKSSALTKTSFTWRDDSTSKMTSGALGDLGVHLIDMLWFLLQGEIHEADLKTIMKTNVPIRENKTIHVDDYSAVYGKLKSGTYVELIASKSSTQEETGVYLNLIGTKQELRYESAWKRTYKIKQGIEWVEHSYDAPQTLTDPPNEIFGWSDSFIHQLQDWQLKATRTPAHHNVCIADFRDGLRSQETLDMFIRNRVQPKKEELRHVVLT
ncbi:Gfo/Idh/MocA family protein [Paenibacillus sp. YYML68]|uniref:Gfo/Idh/MocA family protein n=1 Tax=Paenibacillus sp. YYML68 TaxID=2909250 RepID=UPI0024933D33|nr:Gfo/Idh/MocA family oxidoreductase [Paenibacillus sp. YYML68]